MLLAAIQEVVFCAITLAVPQDCLPASNPAAELFQLPCTSDDPVVTEYALLNNWKLGRWDNSTVCWKPWQGRVKLANPNAGMESKVVEISIMQKEYLKGSVLDRCTRVLCNPDMHVQTGAKKASGDKK